MVPPDVGAAGFSTRPSPRLSPIPASEWTPQARKTLGQACGREVDLSPRVRRDHAMIAFVSAYRWKAQRKGWSFAETTRRHANLHKPTKRTRWALGLPGTLSDREHWNRLGAYLDRWQRGLVANPCNGAVTWMGRQPTAKALATKRAEGLKPIACGTVNVALGRASG